MSILHWAVFVGLSLKPAYKHIQNWFLFTHKHNLNVPMKLLRVLKQTVSIFQEYTITLKPSRLAGIYFQKKLNITRSKVTSLDVP